MNKRIYPYNLAYVQKLAADLDPVKVPFQSGRYNLGLGITNRCNFDCPICYYHAPGGRDRARDMPLSLLRRILTALPDLAGIIVGLEGEPLLHPEFSGILDLAALHCGGITLITNGSLVNVDVCRALAQLSSSCVFLSIDAAGAALYEKLRKGGNLSLFMRNADMLAKAARCLFHATVFRQNLDSLTGLPALAASLGIKCLSFQQLRVHSGSASRSIEAASTFELETWLDKILAEAGKYNMAIVLDRFFGGEALQKKLRMLMREYPLLSMPEFHKGHCEHADSLAGITADGRLFPCAGDFEPVPMREYSFDAVFNHPYLVALRALHKAERISGACGICMNMRQSLHSLKKF